MEDRTVRRAGRLTPCADHALLTTHRASKKGSTLVKKNNAIRGIVLFSWLCLAAFPVYSQEEPAAATSGDSTAATSATRPGTIRNLVATPGNGQVVLAWVAPTSDGGSPITGYEYKYSSEYNLGGSSWAAVADVQATVLGLTNGTEYTFEVRAVNSVGAGGASRGVATPATVPGAVQNLVATPGNGQVALSWASPASDGGAPITAALNGHAYEYQYRPGGTGWTPVANRTTISGLTNGTEYTFEVRAINSMGAGATSRVSATPATVPGSVENLSATPGNGQVTLSWSPPFSDGGSSLTGYQYQYRPGGTGWTDVSATSATVSGLTNGTAYTFEVRAVNGVGAGAVSQTAATPLGAPGSVENLVATPGAGQVVLSWSPPGSDGGSPLTGYQYRLAGTGWTDVSAASATVSGLTNGTAYTFEVRAVNGVGAGAVSQTAAMPLGAPGSVQNLSATTGTGQVTLAWSAPSSDGGSPLTGYQYQYRPGGTGWTDVSATSATVSGLTNGTAYTFEVRAVNGVGAGAVSQTAATPLGAPGSVENLVATPGAGQVVLSWSPPGSDGGSPLTGYQYRLAGTGWTDVSAASATISGLTNGTEYTFEVRAVNAIGTGAVSQTSATPVGVPTVVAELSATAGDGQVTLAWEVPTSTEQVDAWQYGVKKGGGSYRWHDIPGSGGSTRSYTVADLTNGQAYRFKIRAKNAVGEGPASNRAEATPATVPSAIQKLWAAPGYGQVVLAWYAPWSDGGAAVTGYEYQYRPGGSGWTAVDRRRATISGLTNGTEYTFEVRSINRVGYGPTSTVVSTPLGTPGVVVDLSATAGDGQVVLAWASPSANGGSPITGYEYQYRPGGSGWTAVSNATATVSGLTNGTAYTFEVRAVNAVGTGDVSQTVATPATVPGAVENLLATAGDRQVVLAWASPSGDGGSPLTGYEYQYRPGGTGWTAVLAASATISGLTNGTSYTFEVRAVNAIGTGVVSQAAATPVGAPTVVADLAATAGDGQVTLAWEVPTGTEQVAAWQYGVKKGGGSYRWHDIPGSGGSTRSYTVANLTNGQPYRFKIRAKNAAGEGPHSNRAEATPATVPGAIAALSATAGDRQVVLSWNVPSSDGGSPITGYQYRYQPGGSGWTDVADATATVPGLTSGTDYIFEVRAVNRVGQGPQSTVAVTTEGAPGAVENLSATVGDRQVVLAWAAPTSDGGSPITGYQYQYQPGGSGWTAVANATATVSGLKNGTAYTFEVCAVNRVGQGAGTSVTATPATVPGAVVDLSATAGDGQVTLAWAAPSSDGGSPITNYQYRYWYKLGDYFVLIGSSDGTRVSDVRVTVSGLNNGTTYIFEVRAVNRVGQGSGTSVTATPATVPTVVADLSATVGDGQVTLAWEVPTSTEQVAAWQYGVKKGGGSYRWHDIPGSSGSTRSYIVADLTNGQTYRFKIRAKNAAGEGPHSNRAVAKPATVPGAVQKLSATAGDRQVVLAWSPPSSDGSSPITGYQYRYRPGGTGWTAVSNAPATVSGLKNGTAYTFEVRAVNRIGQGRPSTAAATTATVPGAVVGLSATAGAGQVVLAWNAPASDGGSPITGYEYRYRPGGSGWTDVTGRRADVTGLTKSTEYTFEVRAVNRRGHGPPSTAVATPLGPPPPVKNLVVTPGAGQVVLSWAAPASDGGSPITGYLYNYRLLASSAAFFSVWAFPDLGEEVADGRVTVSGLKNGSTYIFEVRAVNRRGHGPRSTVMATPLGPSAVENLVATPGAGQVLLSWDTPSSDGGAPITGYQYRYWPGGTGWTSVAGRRADVTGLTKSTEYTFEVRAVNRRSHGPTSTAVATPLGPPLAVKNLSATLGVRQIVLFWDAPALDGGSPITGYQYQYRPGGTGWTNVAGRRGTIRGLKDDTSYTFEVRAVNRMGSGPTSTIGPPGAVQNLSAPRSRGQVLLGWHSPALDGGSPITGYQYQYRPGGTGWTSVAGRRVTISGLKDGTDYTFEVRAVNRMGPGPTSTPNIVPQPRKKADTNPNPSALPSSISATPLATSGKKAAAQETPATSGLTLNFPNPFNASTQITYQLAEAGPVRLEIYNVLGQPVKTLVAAFQTVGFYQIAWDARDQRGAQVATGVYFTRLFYPGGVQVRRLLYLK